MEIAKKHCLLVLFKLFFTIDKFSDIKKYENF